MKNGEFRLEDTPYCYIGVFARYGDNPGRTLGLIGGDTIRQGAVASTYAHDHHNLLVIGKNAMDMQLAANEVIAKQGGICTVVDGQVSAFLPLPVGGVLSDEPLATTASHVQTSEGIVRQARVSAQQHDHVIEHSYASGQSRAENNRLGACAGKRRDVCRLIDMNSKNRGEPYDKRGLYFVF